MRRPRRVAGAGCTTIVGGGAGRLRLSVQPTGAPSRRTTRQGAGAQAGRRASRARTAPADVRQPAWLNTPLGLVRLRLDRCDDPGRWVVLIRAHLDRNGGRPGYLAGSNIRRSSTQAPGSTSGAPPNGADPVSPPSRQCLRLAGAPAQWAAE